MSVLDKTLLTTVGAAKYAYNDANSLPTQFSQIALGDNNGADFIPAPTDGNCVHEVYRANINSITIDPVDSTIIILQLVLPASVGGFTVKEARIYDADGVVMYTANPYFIKSINSSDQNLLFRIKRSNASQVTLLVDPSITLASQTYVNNAINTHNIDASAHAATTFATKAGVQNDSYNYAVAGGTGDAITVTYTPAYAAWVDGMTFFAKITAANTTSAPTISPNGLAAKTIVIGNGVTCRANMLSIGMIAAFKYSATLDKILLQNPNLTGGLLNVQTFKTAGSFTYTPTPGTKYYVAEVCGGGGGGGGSSACTATQASVGSGGVSGAYGKGIYFPANPSATVSVTVGAAGVGGTVGVGPATSGGTSSFGALLSATGGAGAPNGSAFVPPTYGDSYPGGTSTIIGDNIFNIPAQLPPQGASLTVNMVGNNGGANSPFGNGGKPAMSSGGSVNGNNGTGNGSGGGGAVSTASGAAKTGGNGTPGIVIVWEYM